jgi:hypothetical protein
VESKSQKKELFITSSGRFISMGNQGNVTLIIQFSSLILSACQQRVPKTGEHGKCKKQKLG